MAETSSPVATPRVKGPLVWLGMDQQELDDAYDQTVYAPNQPLLAKRRAAASESVLKRFPPERVVYGPSEHEKLDIYKTHKPNAPVNVYVHGGAWRQRPGQRLRLPRRDVCQRRREFRRPRLRANSRHRRQPAANGAASPQRRRLGLQKCRALRRRCQSRLHHRPFLRRALERLRVGHRLAKRFWPAARHSQRLDC